MAKAILPSVRNAKFQNKSLFFLSPLNAFREDGDDDWSCVDTISGAHDSTVWSLAFNGDGDKLATVGEDREEEEDVT
jgi:WD40 repeat protein